MTAMSSSVTGAMTFLMSGVGSASGAPREHAQYRGDAPTRYPRIVQRVAELPQPIAESLQRAAAALRARAILRGRAAPRGCAPRRSGAPAAARPPCHA